MINANWLRVENNLATYADFQGEARMGKLLAQHAQHLLTLLPEFIASPSLREIKPHLSHGTLVLPLDDMMEIHVLFEDDLFSLEQYHNQQLRWSKRVTTNQLLSELENFVYKIPQP